MASSDTAWRRFKWAYFTYELKKAIKAVDLFGLDNDGE